jgi:hypothetical protein
MQKIAPRRRLKSFKEVTKHVGVQRQIRRLAEEMDLTKPRSNDPTVDLNYFTMSIPTRLSNEEKSARLSEMVDTVTAVAEGSDVVILGMWVSPTE